MVGRYLDGSRPVHASDLLEDAAGRVLKQREACNCLILNRYGIKYILIEYHPERTELSGQRKR